jgi:hypothetical protein
VSGKLIPWVLPWAAGLGSGAGFLLPCLSRGAGPVYTVNATATFVLAAADLVFVLRTGRLRLGS